MTGDDDFKSHFQSQSQWSVNESDQSFNSSLPIHSICILNSASYFLYRYILRVEDDARLRSEANHLFAYALWFFNTSHSALPCLAVMRWRWLFQFKWRSLRKLKLHHWYISGGGCHLHPVSSQFEMLSIWMDLDFRRDARRVGNNYSNYICPLAWNPYIRHDFKLR